MLAHELGHSIIFSEVGFPSNPNDEGIDYGGLHESAGDLVAIVSVLHFNSVLDRLLNNTRGNLFTVNELDRVGELDQNREIRIAFNSKRMSDVGFEPHERSLPLTGALFDVMVEVFQKSLVENNLITRELAELSTQGIGRGQDLEGIQQQFDEAFTGNERGFMKALLGARDYLGNLLATTWSMLRPPDFLTCHDVLRTVLRADRRLTNGAHQQTIRECFVWREISVAPGSILLRPRSLSDCAFAVEYAEAPLSGLQKDQALAYIRREVEREINARKNSLLA